MTTASLLSLRIASFPSRQRESKRACILDAGPGPCLHEQSDYVRMPAQPGMEGSNLPAFIIEPRIAVQTSKTDSVVHLLSLLVFHKMHIHFLYK